MRLVCRKLILEWKNREAKTNHTRGSALALLRDTGTASLPLVRDKGGHRHKTCYETLLPTDDNESS